MTPTEYLSLSTKLAEDLKAWIEESREHGGLSPDQLVLLTNAAEIIDETTVRVTRQQTNE